MFVFVMNFVQLFLFCGVQDPTIIFLVESPETMPLCIGALLDVADNGVMAEVLSDVLGLMSNKRSFSTHTSKSESLGAHRNCLNSHSKK